ncbi:hypothetical protein [Actinoplanes sp. HUAS TT8]
MIDLDAFRSELARILPKSQHKKVKHGDAATIAFPYGAEVSR